ncbi:ABC transporter ATP-binding protein [Facklamia sp. DSM 111018]|uniref:ABC transporter ATP-binding protein n=1 Tax=Facklamia lactis TaxID=2749967 RepID=A0ABS0LN47_9LACT|nr:ABC transporter ATP-binding protein [Facklamia lactis]MBG9979761.1 ABC transporter ATP-binding protein [Facklamia lactis]MBG9985559.1 ABC transporter ATP-binding protein [Facklamia lactis]
MHTSHLLEIKQLSFGYGCQSTDTLTIQNFSLNVNKGEIVGIVGQSGCGKTTLLNLIAGLILSSEQSILINGRPPKENHQIAYVFQSPALFDWLTVRGNIEYGVRRRKLAPSIIRQEADRLLHATNLWAYADAYPQDLSGGMQQRVALARALIVKPDLLLMDEPFSALDYQTRSEMQELVLELWKDYQPAIMIVSHDIDEMIYLADKIVVLQKTADLSDKCFEIPFQRPRDFEAIMKLPLFNQIKQRIRRSILQ